MCTRGSLAACVACLASSCLLLRYRLSESSAEEPRQDEIVLWTGVVPHFFCPSSLSLN